MAVARDGKAWTVFTDGNLYSVDTQNAHCSTTGFAPGQNGWTTFGMGAFFSLLGLAIRNDKIAEFAYSPLLPE